MTQTPSDSTSTGYRAERERYPFFGEGFDFTDPDLLLRGVPVRQFALLRSNAPVWWNAQQPGRGGGFNDGGYWVVSKHRHIREISRNSSVWSSHVNGAVIRFTDDMSCEALEFNKEMLLSQDAPRHTRLRRLVSRTFTPRAISALEDTLRAAALSIVGEAKEKGGGDFVDDIARRMSMLAIFDLLGVPTGDRDRVFYLSNSMMSFDDDDSEDPAAASAEFYGYAYAMADERKKRPMDDVVSDLVTAEIDGSPLTATEFANFFTLLTVAGNETTRIAIAHGLDAFMGDRAQWELYKRERPPSAVEEIVRFSTPVNVLQRTALRDTELGGVKVKSGERVGLFYGSANFDEEVFEDPFRFDVLRSPNPHLGFGGTGPHYCIGAGLARLEINLIFNALADQCPGISKCAEPERLRAPWINGIKRLRVDYGT